MHYHKLYIALAVGLSFLLNACNTSEQLELNNPLDPQSPTFSDDLVFTDSLNSRGVFVDMRDSQHYEFTVIGDQIWMAENLNFETDSNSYCLDDQVENCEKYGRLYPYPTAINGYSEPNGVTSSVVLSYPNGDEVLPGDLYRNRGVCPEGWMFPSQDDWEDMLAYIAKDLDLGDVQDGGDWDSLSVHLKSIDGWDPYDHTSDSNPYQGKDTYGMNILASGYITHDGVSYQMERQASRFWTSVEYPHEIFQESSAVALIFSYQGSRVNIDSPYQPSAYSIRCFRWLNELEITQVSQ